MSAQDDKEYDELEERIKRWSYSPYLVTKTKAISAACWLVLRARGQDKEIWKLKKALERERRIVKKLRVTTVPKLRAATRYQKHQRRKDV